MTEQTETNGTIIPSTVPSFTESPASLNLRFNYQGYDGVMLTLRANSGLEVIGKMDAALAKLAERVEQEYQRVAHLRRAIAARRAQQAAAAE